MRKVLVLPTIMRFLACSVPGFTGRSATIRNRAHGAHSRLGHVLFRTDPQDCPRRHAKHLHPIDIDKMGSEMSIVLILQGGHSLPRQSGKMILMRHQLIVQYSSKQSYLVSICLSPVRGPPCFHVQGLTTTMTTYLVEHWHDATCWHLGVELSMMPMMECKCAVR